VSPGSANKHREEEDAADTTTEAPAEASAARCDAGTVAGTAAGTAAAVAAVAAAGVEGLPPKRRSGIDAVGSQMAGLTAAFLGATSHDAPGRTFPGPGKLIKPSAVRGCFVLGPSTGSFGAGLGWLCTVAGMTTAEPPCEPLKCLCQFHEASRGESATGLGSLGSLGAQGANRCDNVMGATAVPVALAPFFVVLPNGEANLRGVVVPPNGDAALRGVVFPDGEANFRGVVVPM